MESDDFWENEDLLLRFVYGILKVYPRAKVWVEEDGFYTLEDLEKMKEQPYDGN